MSELKTYNSERIYWAVEQVEQVAGDIDDLHLDDNLFYLKSEADKEIDFWKKESHDHYERWFSLNKQYEEMNADLNTLIEAVSYIHKQQHILTKMLIHIGYRADLYDDFISNCFNELNNLEVPKEVTDGTH